MKKILVILSIIVFLNSLITPSSSANSLAYKMLFDSGIRLYEQAMYDDALHEFKKALILKPNYEPALNYIHIIEQEKVKEEKIAPTPTEVIKGKGPPKTPQKVMKKRNEVTKARLETPHSQMAEFLCESGMRFYKQARYDEALQEFKKALMLKPNYESALNYISMIEQRKARGEIEVTPEGLKVAPQVMKERMAIPTGLPEKEVLPGKVAPLQVLRLEASLSQVSQPIEIPQGQSMVIAGEDIQRFLVIEPNILTIEKKSPDELLVTAQDIGYTYVHIWDNNGRWTLEFLSVLPQPEGPTYEELLRREEEESRSFKLRYALDWTSSESGKRIKLLERSIYNWQHRLDLTGETPYGKLSSGASIRRDTRTTDLTYLNLDLTEGQIGLFKGFRLQGFDYSIPFSNLAVPGVGLRGAMLASPAFKEKIDYTAFWGREGGGRYGNLSPSLMKIKDSFLDGFNLEFSPLKGQNYRFSVGHGWGSSRLENLPPYTYDVMSNWTFKNFGLGYEIASDSDRFAHLLHTNYAWPKVSLATRVRNVDKNFYSITGRGSQAGEFGSLFNLNYKVTEKLDMNSALNIYQDRLYSPEGREDRWNEDFQWRAGYGIDPQTSLSVNYSLQNLEGGLSQSRNQSEGVNLTKKFKTIRDIDTYVNYTHQDNQNFSTPSASYINDKVNAGLRFDIIGNLSGYLSREMNWNEETYSGIKTTPNAYEAGLECYSDLGNYLSGDFRLTYRNEEDTGAASSFLSGEDYLDGTAGLAYKWGEDKEIHGSGHIRDTIGKSWKTMCLDLDFSLGMSYIWDTGIRWEPIGNIDGYVFKDLNSDGLRQRDEAPVEGIKISLGKDKSQVTDMFGYYRFKNITARKAYITLDASSLPSGFVVTVPINQEVAIANNRTARVDFGIISRSEITGLVFEDVNGDGKYDPGDRGVSGAIITLEDATKAVSDSTGRYSFSTASPGEHSLTLNLDSLPIYYLPQAALTKKITLFEGVSYIHNIPLKRIQE